MLPAYYNDNDAYCAQWLRNLIAAGEIPLGDVDERGIQDIDPADLEGYGQVHFFAGIGGWPLALRLAGWPDPRPVWTGSCPCQPLSSAGQRKGHADERHLWPAFYALIAECKPPIILGEQVASKDGREWLAGVRADLEHLGYAVGAADLPAAGVGAPQIRQRLWWVAQSSSHGHKIRCAAQDDVGSRQARGEQRRELAPHQGTDSRLADADSRERRPDHDGSDAEADGRRHVGRHSETSRMGNTECPERRPVNSPCGNKGRARNDETKNGAATRQAPFQASSWGDFDLIPCTDGKARRVESGTFPLATGIPNRVGRLRAYGNSICPPLAAEFIRAVMEVRP